MVCSLIDNYICHQCQNLLYTHEAHILTTVVTIIVVAKSTDHTNVKSQSLVHLSDNYYLQWNTMTRNKFENT